MSSHLSPIILHIAPKTYNNTGKSTPKLLPFSTLCNFQVEVLLLHLLQIVVALLCHLQVFDLLRRQVAVHPLGRTRLGLSHVLIDFPSRAVRVVSWAGDPDSLPGGV